MPCSFCREDCRDSGGRFASTASILCRKTPGGGTAARFSMQFARAARPGGPGCRPCGCGWQPARASRPWRSGFLPPLQLRAAAGVRRGFPLRLLRVPFLALSLSAWFGALPKGEYGRGFACAKIRGFWPAIRVLARSEPILGRSGALSSRTEFADLGFSRARAPSCVERGRGRVPERGFVAKNRRFSRTERRLFGRRELERRA